MYVSANEKAASLNLHRYTTGNKKSLAFRTLANSGRETFFEVGLALFTTLFCSPSSSRYFLLLSSILSLSLSLCLSLSIS